MVFNVIAACLVPTGGIGKDGRIPWRVPSDLRRFRYLTSHPGPAAIIMGRATFESLPGGKPLPGRTNIVVSTTMMDQENSDVVVVRSFEDAVAFVRSKDFTTVHVIGGESLYRQALVHPACTRVYLTEVQVLSGTCPDCDRFFPFDLLRDHFSIVATSRNIDGPYHVTFVDLIRDVIIDSH